MQLLIAYETAKTELVLSIDLLVIIVCIMIGLFWDLTPPCLVLIAEYLNNSTN